MKNKHTIALYTLVFILITSVNPLSAQDKEKGFSLRRFLGISPKLEEVFIDQHIQLNGLSEYAEESESFYRNRQYKPAWFDGKSLNSQGRELMEILKDSWKEGLPEPTVYLAKAENALMAVNKRQARNNSLPVNISEADVNLSLAWFDYASKMSTGILDPADLNVIWEILPDKPDLAGLLEETLNDRNISRSFDELKPQHEQYDLMLQEFTDLMRIKSGEGWPLPGMFPLLKEKDSDANVVRIKKYLAATGDLDVKDTAYLNAPDFDDKLTGAVKNFQIRHGLEQDGIVGEATLQHMNVPLEYRIDQIRLNMDRIRWLPDDFGDHHILINIPDFSLIHHKDDEVLQEMKVVVGQNENYTPVLEDTLHSVIFNPAWNVPNSIATNEIFPKMLEDTTYMKRNNYSILLDSYISKDTIDYRNYDWSEVSRDSFPYFIVQHPGPLNSLGQVQFMLQNQYSIFLHDSPANHLFNIEQRDFSHGCIRLERPAELAVVLLRDQMPADSVVKWVSEDEKRVVRLDEKIPVHLIYKTAWVDENKQLQFRDDIYGFDKISMPVLKRSFLAMATFREN